MTARQREVLLYIGDVFATLYRQQVEKITLQDCGAGYIIITRVTFANRPAA